MEPSNTSGSSKSETPSITSKICNIAECINWADMESKYIPEKGSGSVLAPRSRKKQKISRLQARIRGLYQDRINMEAERVSIDRENKALLSEMEFIIKTINALNARHATHSFHRLTPKEPVTPLPAESQPPQQYEPRNSYSPEDHSSHNSFSSQFQQCPPQMNSGKMSEPALPTQMAKHEPHMSPHLYSQGSPNQFNPQVQMDNGYPQLKKSNSSEYSPIQIPSPVDLQAMFPENMSTYLSPAQPLLFSNPYMQPKVGNNFNGNQVNSIPILKGSESGYMNGTFLNPFAPSYLLQPQDVGCNSSGDQNYSVPPPSHPYCYPSPAVPMGETNFAPRQSSDFSIWFQSVLADYTPR